MNNPVLSEVKLLQKSRCLQLHFADGQSFELPCEYLRVFSPSAEVRGHHDSERKLVTGKQDVNIIGIEPVGNYALKFIFDDGHDTGLYTWEYLFELSVQHKINWQDYCARAKNEAQHQ